MNPAGADGLLFGNPAQLGIQATAVVATLVFAAAGTAVILLVLKPILGLRLTPEEERIGLDLTQHSEIAYAFGAGSYDETTSGHASSSVPARAHKVAH